MAGRRLDYEQAARAIRARDRLEDVNIKLSVAPRALLAYPKLSISAKSVVDYKARATHLGTIHGDTGQKHYMMLARLADAMRRLELHRSDGLPE